MHTHTKETKLSLPLSILLVIIALMAIYFAVRNAPVKDSSFVDESVAACKTDAIVCPDGSTVGRTGSQCAFVACANQEVFTGKLVEIDRNYFLETEAPDNLKAQTDVYGIPLKLQPNNNIGSLVGKTVNARGVFRVGNILEVSSLEEAKTAVIKTSDEIGIGQTKNINGVDITFNKLVQDSRCPVDVQCIQAGAVTANVTFKVGNEIKTFNMPSDEVPQQFAGYKISIEEVKPARMSNTEPEANSYRITFKVMR